MPKSPSLSLNIHSGKTDIEPPHDGDATRGLRGLRSPRIKQPARNDMGRDERSTDSHTAAGTPRSHAASSKMARPHTAKGEAPKPMLTATGSGSNGMSIRQVSNGSSTPTATVRALPYRQSSGSTPDLTRPLDSPSVSSSTASPDHERFDQRTLISHGRPTQAHPPSANYVDAVAPKRSGQKHFFNNLLSRSRSIRSDDYLSNTQQPQQNQQQQQQQPLKPARFTPESEQRYVKRQADLGGSEMPPAKDDRSFREMMHRAPRNRSADRHTEPDQDTAAHPRDKSTAPFSFKDNPGVDLFANIKKSGTKAADGLGKAGKGFFDKLTRSGSSHEREPAPSTDPNYVFKVINLPLVEQVRKTRISKRLAASKDKTEFWMPALPWRCIDYLNMNGCEEEGLYRLSGSLPDIKAWQVRFDQELDINLFDETNLHDINIIGSMFKSWLRELPDEIFPKATQKKILENCKDAKSTPQMLKDELSKLPPFNYYLLFAITCHISLMHSCSEKNKMDYRNICICFQPCIKIEAFCFQFLILDWRNCWQGCWTEKDYIDREMRILEPDNYPSPSAIGQSTPNDSTSQLGDERAVSSGSSKPSTINSTASEKPRSHEDKPPMTTPTRRNGRRNELPKLSPMQPMSPIGPI